MTVALGSLLVVCNTRWTPIPQWLLSDEIGFEQVLISQEALMAVTKLQKEQIMKKFKTSELDTGSSEVQVALLTNRITEMSAHFAIHKKDVHGVRGLMRAVGRRRKLLDYLKRTNSKAYETLIKELEIRK